MPEKVSVLFVAPTDGADKAQIEATRQSIVGQTYPQSLIEMVEVNYVSTAPGGLASAMNAARDAVTGTYVVHAVPGVVWDGFKVERQVDFLTAHPEASGCVHHMTVRSKTGSTQKLSCDEIRAYGPHIGNLLGMPWGPGAAMLVREVLDLLGAYRGIEETFWEYMLRMVEKGQVPLVMDDDLAIWQTDQPSFCGKMGLVASGLQPRFLKAYLDRMALADLFASHMLVSEPYGHLVRAALYFRHGDYDTAHTICQTVDPDRGLAAASYWHAMMHRREPDFKNARGWFERGVQAGSQANLHREVIALLLRAIQVPEYGDARDIALQFLRHLQAQGTWDALCFLDLCQMCEQSETDGLRRLLEDVQDVEFRALFDWTFRQAAGKE